MSRAFILLLDSFGLGALPDRERQIHIMNASRYFLPHILALTTSSPFASE